MKFSNKKIEELIKKIAGEDVLQLVKILKNKKNVSEAKLTEYCNKELNEVRSMLYKLYEFGLASFVKKRNKDGWYIYYWSLEINKIHKLFVDFKKKELKKLKKELRNEKNKKFYICPNKCVRLDFEAASSQMFRCPECNGFLDYEKGNDKVISIKEKINNIKKVI